MKWKLAGKQRAVTNSKRVGALVVVMLFAGLAFQPTAAAEPQPVFATLPTAKITAATCTGEFWWEPADVVVVEDDSGGVVWEVLKWVAKSSIQSLVITGALMFLLPEPPEFFVAAWEYQCTASSIEFKGTGGGIDDHQVSIPRRVSLQVFDTEVDEFVSMASCEYEPGILTNEPGCSAHADQNGVYEGAPVGGIGRQAPREGSVCMDPNPLFRTINEPQSEIAAEELELVFVTELEAGFVVNTCKPNVTICWKARDAIALTDSLTAMSATLLETCEEAVELD